MPQVIVCGVVILKPYTARSNFMVPIQVKVLVDGADAFGIDFIGASELIPGKHTIGVTVQDSDGELNVISIPVTQPEPPPTPPPPTGLHLEFGPWIQPGNVGNTGGGSAKPHGTYTITQITDVENPFIVVRTAPLGAYDNYYWYQKLGAKQATKFTWIGELAFPSDIDLNACQAFEWEMQQADNNYVYNMAWQMNFAGGGVMRYFDFVNKAWKTTNTKINIDKALLGPEMYLKLISEFVIDHEKHTCTHASLTMGETKYDVNVTQPAKIGASSNYLNYAFQMDTNGKNQPYAILLRNMDCKFS